MFGLNLEHDASYYLETYLTPLFSEFIAKSKTTEEQQLLFVWTVIAELYNPYKVPQTNKDGSDNWDYVRLIEYGFACNLQILGKQMNGGSYNSGEILNQTARTYSINYAKISDNQEGNVFFPPTGGNFCVFYKYLLAQYAMLNGRYRNSYVIGSKSWR